MKEVIIIKKYEYMVVYSFLGGLGRIQIITEKPIESYDDVQSLDETIKKSNGLTNVFATDFKLLREYEEE